jgi:hypothetical protein
MTVPIRRREMREWLFAKEEIFRGKSAVGAGRE